MNKTTYYTKVKEMAEQREHTGEHTRPHTDAGGLVLKVSTIKAHLYS